MKIGIVLSSTPAYSETFFNSKIKGLQQYGFEVVLFVQQHSSEFDLCEVRVSNKVYKNPIKLTWTALKSFISLMPRYKEVFKFIKLERFKKKDYTSILKNIYLNAHILKMEVDCLHFGFATMTLGKENIAKSIDAKMAVSFRGFDIAIYPLKNPNCYDVLWSKIDKVHTISDDLLVKAYQLGLHQDTPVQKITPAIDVTVFKDPVGTIKKFNESIHFLTVARLHWKKGLILTLEALSLLKQQNIDFTYTIVGEGQDYERIAFTVLQLDLHECVFLVGKKNSDDIVKLYKASNIYIQYSISEGFCNAVLEAQAMGLLCVVSDAEGLSENVIHEQTGWVVPKCNVNKLAETLERVIKLPEEDKKQLSLRAQERVKNNFNIDKQREKFIKFYRN